MAMALMQLNPNSGATELIVPATMHDAALYVPADAFVSRVNRSSLDGSAGPASQLLPSSGVIEVPRVLAPAFVLAIEQPEDVYSVAPNTSVTLRAPPPSQTPATLLYWDLRAAAGQVVVPAGACVGCGCVCVQLCVGACMQVWAHRAVCVCVCVKEHKENVAQRERVCVCVYLCSRPSLQHAERPPLPTCPPIHDRVLTVWTYPLPCPIPRNRLGSEPP